MFEGYPGFLRFRFDPGAAAENALITVENPLTGVKTNSRSLAYLDAAREITVPVPAQSAGAFVWYVTVEYEASGRKRHLMPLKL